jgi:hypothetical protein
LGSVVTGDVRHAGFYQVSRRAGILPHRVFTRSARIMHQSGGFVIVGLFWFMNLVRDSFPICGTGVALAR